MIHPAIKHYLWHAPLQAVKNACTRAGLTRRSPEWPAARAEWLSVHPTCAACGSKYCLQVHHKKPFHLYPALELDPGNFITLCEASPSDHHCQVGHLGNWKNFNPNVERDAARLLSSTGRAA